MTNPADHKARIEALDIRRSKLVQAGAGSGKTAILTIRYLLCLAVCNEPEQVPAITFTRKAVNEMKVRAHDALVDCRNGVLPTNDFEKLLYDAAAAVLDRDKERGWGLVENPSRLRIVTFDGMAHLLSRMAPIASQLGGAVSVSDNPDELYSIAVDRFFADIEDNSLEWHGAMMNLLRHTDNHQAKAKRLLVSLLARRDQWLPHIIASQDQDAFLAFISETVSEIAQFNLARANAVLMGHKSSLTQLWEFAASNLPVDSTNPAVALSQLDTFPEATGENVKLYRLIAEFLCTKGGAIRSRVTAKEGFPAASSVKDADAKAELKEMKDQVSEVLSALSEEGSDAITQLLTLPSTDLSENGGAFDLLSTLSQVLPILVSHLQLVFAEKGEADHSQVFFAALNSLGAEDSPTELAMMMDHAIQFLLVDEFQDTSIPQIQLLERLTEGWMPGDGRSLFVVGDPKQGIYSFRSANVSNFLAAQKFGIGNIELDVVEFTTNFRSQLNIVDWNNETFEHSFPSESDLATGAVSYTRSDAFNPELSGQAVHIKPFSGDLANDAEADYIVSEIKNILQNDSDDSIAVLVRNRSHLKELIPAMKEAGIAWQATDIDPLSNVGCVSDLLMLTRAITRLGDRIAWAALLRSPMVGLTLNDLHEVMGDDKFSLIWDRTNQVDPSTLSKEGQASLGRLIPTMNATLDRYQRKPLRTLVEGCWIALGGPACARSSSDLDAANSFLDLLSNHEMGGDITDISALNEAAERLYARAQVSEENSVQVMTMHKSKGLQFDHVFLPRLNGRPANDDRPMLAWNSWFSEDGTPRLAICPMPEIGGEEAPLYNFLNKEQAKKRLQENTRLIYVAATRAIKRLHLSFTVNFDDKGSVLNPSSGSLLSCIWNSPALTSAIDAIDVNVTVRQSEDADNTEATPVKEFVRLDTKWTLPSLNMDSRLKAFRGAENGFGDDNHPQMNWDNRTMRVVGTVMHRILQDCVDRGIAHYSDEQLTQITPFWKKLLQANGLPLNKLDDSLKVLKHGITSMMNDEFGQWILGGGHDQALTEFPMMMNNGVEFEQLIMDLVIVANGQRHIIDYKSSFPAQGQDVESFMMAELNKYKAKMLKYKACSEAAFDEPVTIALYFPMIGKVAIYTDAMCAAEAA